MAKLAGFYTRRGRWLAPWAFGIILLCTWVYRKESLSNPLFWVRESALARLSSILSGALVLIPSAACTGSRNSIKCCLQWTRIFHRCRLWISLLQRPPYSSLWSSRWSSLHSLTRSKPILSSLLRPIRRFFLNLRTGFERIHSSGPVTPWKLPSLDGYLQPNPSRFIPHALSVDTVTAFLNNRNILSFGADLRTLPRLFLKVIR